MRVSTTGPVVVALVVVGICLYGAGCSPISGNKPPETPTVVCPDTVVAGARVAVHVSAIDPESDSVAFQLQWNDSVTGWFSYTASGETVVIYHTLEDTGVVRVKARAKDKENASAWSAELPIAVAPPGPAHPDSICDTLPLVDEYVSSCAVSPTGDYLYVAYASSESITPVRLADRTREPSFSVGDPGWNLVVSPDGRHLYMTVHNDSFVDVIRTADRTLEARVPVGLGAYGLCVTPDGQYVWVAVYEQYRLEVIRTSDNTVSDTIGTFSPWGPCTSGSVPPVITRT